MSRKLLLSKFKHWDKITNLNNSINSFYETMLDMFDVTILGIVLLSIMPLIYIKDKLYKIYSLKLFNINKKTKNNIEQLWRVRNYLYQRGSR